MVRKTAQAPEQEAPPQEMQLEAPDQRIRTVMVPWGQATTQAINELALFAPGWASWLTTVYQLVDDIMGQPAP